jgi:hypothetical protein
VRNERNRELDIANYEDIAHLSSLWSKADLTNAEIRQSANVLRRLLHYKEILGSASPRSIRLTFNSLDNKALVRAAQNGHMDFFQSGGTTALGVWFRASTISRFPKEMNAALAGFNPEAVIPLKLDSFLDQPVFFFRNSFVSRKSVLLYVANKAAGTHFDEDRTGEFEVLNRIRMAQTIQMNDGIPSFGFNVDAINAINDDLVPTGKGIDPVFIELSAAIRHFTESPSVKQLSDALKNELGL